MSVYFNLGSVLKKASKGWVCRALMVGYAYCFGILYPSGGYGYEGVEASSQHWDESEFPWAVLVYWGRTAHNTLLEVLQFDYSGFENETLNSLEFSFTLPPQHGFRAFFEKILWASCVELNSNFTYRHDVEDPIYEWDPYFSVRWKKFPWDSFLSTSFAMGEGFSYDSRVPTVEMDTTSDSDGTRHLLNYLLFEVTAGLPRYPAWEIVARIHHRSGVFGLYGAENSGSTAVGFGVRYRFGAHR